MEATTSDIGAVLPRLLPATFAWVGEHGGHVAGAPFVRYLEIGAGSYRIEAGVPTAEPMKGSGEIIASELPGGELAVADHYGPYNTLVETTAALREYVEGQGRRAAGPLWESYVTDPNAEPDPAKLLTEVCIPLE